MTTRPRSLPADRLDPETIASNRARGAWSGRALHAAFLEFAASTPDALAAISVQGPAAEVITRMTYAEMERLSARLAGGLSQLGVAAGDAVALMMPNRAEFGALIFAISRLGAIYAGIPVAAGRREAGAILERSGAKVLLIAGRHQSTDHLDLASQLLEDIPTLEHIVVLDAEPQRAPSWVAFDKLAAADPFSETVAVEPSSIAHLGFTSGTTGAPKGVINTHETLDAVRRNWIDHIGGTARFGAHLVNLIASPVGHHTGYLWGALLTASLGGTAVYLDRWSPATACEVMTRHDVTTFFGAPTFLVDLLRVPGFEASRLPHLSLITVAGAPIPRNLIPAATNQLDAFICPAWGMTEYGIGISGRPSLDPDQLFTADGVPVHGCEVRITVDGDTVGPGRIGALEIRGSGLFLGYYGEDVATSEAFTEDGWFRTGDLAQINSDGLVALQGRSKDIIIRGGENIPVAEIETVLSSHPAIVEAVVVGAPDARLGERACAIVVVEDSAIVRLEEIVGFCLDQGLSKHHLPERLEIVQVLPKTASGKVRKHELRRQLAAGQEL